MYTPADIVWIKNVDYDEQGGAYLHEEGDCFVLDFPNNFAGANLLSPQIGELILLHQRINDVRYFTHLVTPVDDLQVDHGGDDQYRYGRLVKCIAIAVPNTAIAREHTGWEAINFGGICHGNVVNIDNIGGVQNPLLLKYETWSLFKDYFLPSVESDTAFVTSELSSIDNSEFSHEALEGKLYLISHYARERNRAIVNEKKDNALLNGTLSCEVCSFSFQKSFNVNFIECHHKTPIGIRGEGVTRLEDLALVCPNCHRMLHTKFEEAYLNIEQLRLRFFNR